MSEKDSGLVERLNFHYRQTEGDVSCTIREAAARIANWEVALRKIASCKSHHPGDVVDIARAALSDARTPAPERRPGKSKLVYDKEKRTIVTVTAPNGDK